MTGRASDRIISLAAYWGVAAEAAGARKKAGARIENKKPASQILDLGLAAVLR